MIFNCGPTWEERKAKRTVAAQSYYEQWHPFFCLLPRRIGHQCVWLEYVRRKGHYVDGWYNDGGWEFEFRLARDAEWERNVNG